MRKLKYHEKKLLKKVDFLSWEIDNNLHEVRVMKKYYIQKREDYTKWEIFIRNIVKYRYLYCYNWNTGRRLNIKLTYLLTLRRGEDT